MSEPTAQGSEWRIWTVVVPAPPAVEQVLAGRVAAALRELGTATADELRGMIIVRHAIAPTLLTIRACLGMLAAAGHVRQDEPHGPYTWTGPANPAPQ